MSYSISHKKMKQADKESLHRFGILISSVVISNKSTLPSEGFFKRALEAGLYFGGNRAKFFKQHSEKVTEVLLKHPELISLLEC
ncbi:hypothetical protein [Ewingella americana]|uniref:Uncharacterized protein n=1 Tax=Ewingella americana TaxID=41202 RepID=A0A502GEC8_9GAMM|nr:hypothetical protein [Ewingella americana]TPG60091.1 hypothetical protein EAH77_16110 [Ewingella americana]